MKFIDEEHELFFANKILELCNHGKLDVYKVSLLYTLGICPETRSNFNKIFDMEKGEININSLNDSWQTGTSKKVTRMAFNLWNECMYDSEEDLEKGKMSTHYNPSDMFSCLYAPYFYEGVKLRYPEYTKEKSNENEMKR